MGRVDRYMLSQLLVLFGFFALVLVALFWINRAVVLFDRLIGDGQSAIVFLEFTALGLPRLIATVLPIAAFAAAVYVTNRLSSDSELTVMQSTGSSPWRLARPVLMFGLCVGLMMSILSHLLVPMAQAQLKQREAEITQNVTARLLTEGTFLHPTDNVTFYTREIDATGVLRDVFLSDRRDASEGVIYTAAEAYLVRNGDGSTLIMVDGLAQRLDTADNRLATAKFRDFSFDISSLMRSDAPRDLSISNMLTPRLLGDWGRLSDLSGSTRGEIAEELHARFAQAIFCAVAAMMGFATLLMGGFSRFGVWREIVTAFGLLLVIDSLRGVLVQPVLENARLWPVMYVPSALGALLVVAMLAHTAYPGWWRRNRRDTGAAV